MKSGDIDPVLNVAFNVEDNGVILIALTGVWSADEWAQQIELAWAKLPSDFEFEGRPNLVDFTNCAFPESEWVDHFARLAAKLSTRRKEPFRRAVLVREGDEQAEIAVRLLGAIQQARHHPLVETRAFTDRDEAYAWLLEDWARRP